MNREAYERTLASKRVTFYSRSRQCIWQKGETSGNYLELVDLRVDCDNDTLLAKVVPHGPTCHTGTDTCWGETNTPCGTAFLSELQDFIDQRRREMPAGSYTTSLFEHGINRIAQKVGEEALENRHRSGQRHQRAGRVRRSRPALSPHRAPDGQGPARGAARRRAVRAPQPGNGASTEPAALRTAANGRTTARETAIKARNHVGRSERSKKSATKKSRPFPTSISPSTRANSSTSSEKSGQAKVPYSKPSTPSCRWAEAQAKSWATTSPR